MGYRLNRLDEPIFMAVSKPLLNEIGIHHRLESCAVPRCTIRNQILAWLLKSKLPNHLHGGRRTPAVDRPTIHRYPLIPWHKLFSWWWTRCPSRTWGYQTGRSEMFLSFSVVPLQPLQVPGPYVTEFSDRLFVVLVGLAKTIIFVMNSIVRTLSTLPLLP